MNAKELVALSEQMMAFNSIMKGELDKEIKEAKTALDALGSAKTLKADRDSLDKDKAALEASKASYEAIVNETEDGFDAQADHLDKVASQLAADKEILTEERLAFTAYLTEQEAILKAAKKEVESTRKSLLVSMEEVASQRASLESTFADIAKREQAVADKLAALKALV